MKNISISTRLISFSIVALSIAGCGPSADEIKLISNECVRFYKEKRASSGAHVEAIKHWTKKGKLVIELAEMESESSSSYTPGLCLYDQKDKTILLPSIFEQGDWKE